MFSNPGWLQAILIFLILTVFYIELSWLAVQLDTQQKPQPLSIGARIQVAGQIIYLEVPQTAEQQIKGLMYRTVIPRNRGILFEFTPAQLVQLSMQNILIPLDMIFLKDEQIKLINIAVPPCNDNICLTYRSDTAVDQVIQLGGTRTLELGLKIGDTLTIQFLAPETRLYK